MRAYLDLLQDVLLNGEEKEDRTGTGTLSLMGRSLEVDLGGSHGPFPLLTTKKVHFHSVAVELLWMLRGDTSIDFLRQHNVTIWDEWANASFRPDLGYPDGELGPVYGAQWRKWPGKNGPIDQIANVIDEIKNNPTSRRILINAWNVDRIPEMKLPPCHMMAQWGVYGDKLDCVMTMRSCDLFLGLPFNIAQYALLTRMIAEVTGKTARKLVVSIGDAHIYKNHLSQVVTQLRREPGPAPVLRFREREDRVSIDDFVLDDFILQDYEHQGRIPAPVSV